MSLLDEIGRNLPIAVQRHLPDQLAPPREAARRIRGLTGQSGEEMAQHTLFFQKTDEGLEPTSHGLAGGQIAENRRRIEILKTRLDR